MNRDGQQLINRLRNLRTKQLVWLTLLLMFMGWSLNAVTGPLWVHFGIHAKAIEYIGTGLFWFSYFVLWILLPVAAFRSENRFYPEGDSQLRAKPIWFVIGALFVVHVVLFISIIFMARKIY